MAQGITELLIELEIRGQEIRGQTELALYGSQAGLVSSRVDDDLPRVRTNRLASTQDEITHEKEKLFQFRHRRALPL